jgi:UDP-sugar transporter A1/2/3
MIALMVGVIFVQLDLPKAVKTPTSGVTAPAAGAAASRRHLVGFVSVFVCALTSGYASVYFEQILKADAKPAQDGFVPLRTDDEAAMASEVPAPISSTSGPKLSTLVVTNVYLSLYSALALPVVGLVRDGRAIPQTTGFTSLVWAVVILQALGGLIIALVIRWAASVPYVLAWHGPAHTATRTTSPRRLPSL